MLTDHLRQLETVELRHADVHQHHGDVVLEQMFKRLLAGRGLDQVFAEVLQNHLIGSAAWPADRRPAGC